MTQNNSFEKTWVEYIRNCKEKGILIPNKEHCRWIYQKGYGDGYDEGLNDGLNK